MVALKDVGEDPLQINSIRGLVYDGRRFSKPTLAAIIIEDGKIVDIRESENVADLIIPEPTLILPGRINMHVHGRDVFGILPGEEGDQTKKEDSYTLSLALAHGGATHAVCMPNLARLIDNRAAYERQLEWINSKLPHREKPIMDLSMYALVRPESRPFGFDVLYKILWATFKAIDGTNFESDEQVIETSRNYKGHWLTAHSETIAGILADESLPHHIRRTDQAAIDAVKIMLQCAQDFKFHYHDAHISTPEEWILIKEARRRGVSASAEITGQSTRLAYDDFEKMTGLPIIWGQQNPPLRHSEARARMQREVLPEVEVLASDHAPHLPGEKEKGVSGMPQADTDGVVYLESVTEGHLSPAQYVEKGSHNPGKILEKKLGIKKGQLKPGYDADMTLVTLGRPSQIRNEDVLSKCGWTPYHNIRWSNTIEGVVIGGRGRGGTFVYTPEVLRNLRQAV